MDSEVLAMIDWLEHFQTWGEASIMEATQDGAQRQEQNQEDQAPPAPFSDLKTLPDLSS